MCLSVLVIQGSADKECKLSVKYNDPMYNGEKVKIKLTDMNQTPISNASIHIKLENDNDIKEYDVTTNKKGIATLELNDLKEGNCTINCAFNGNNHYKATSSTEKFDYKDVATTTSQSNSNVDPIDANRPRNDPNYKGYTPNHESEITSDGWNPREHEVSRENMGNGNQKIHYDDGYFRIVDSNGYVITYGYG